MVIPQWLCAEGGSLVVGECAWGSLHGGVCRRVQPVDVCRSVIVQEVCPRCPCPISVQGCCCLVTVCRTSLPGRCAKGGSSGCMQGCYCLLGVGRRVPLGMCGGSSRWLQRLQ